MQGSCMPTTTCSPRPPSGRCLVGAVVQASRPTANLKLGWDLMRHSGIEIYSPTQYDHNMGCGQDTWQVPRDVLDIRMAAIRPMLPQHGHKQYTSASSVRGIRHDMLGVGFTDQCIAN
eukprot:9466719-Pyramimonas_sp.AAC.1